MRHFIDLVERYSSELTHFKSYMAAAEFDPYRHWWEVCNWLVDNGYLGDISEMVGHPIDSQDDLNEEDPEIFTKLPPGIQKQCAEWVNEYVMQHDPAQADTHQHMSLSDQHVLKRNTLLVHFSNEARQIAFNGFQYGVDQMDKLGLTGHLSDFDRSGPGYNFAFAANSRDANYGASQGKYGRDAVLFQSSGVKCYHYGDEETQIVFYGPNVKPDEIVYLRRGDGEWQVMPKTPIPNRDYLYQGEFEDCVNWVAKNAAQYRKYLF